MKTLYLIGGTMGVGKTVVSRELERMLPNSVFLDGDWCWDSDPFIVNEETKTMVLENIRFLLARFLRCTAYENVIFCWVMHEQSILDAVKKDLDLTGCRVKEISLVCDAETLRNRLCGDIGRGIRTPDILGRSIARIPLYANLNTIKIDTSDKPVRAIAEEIARLP